VEIKTWNYRAQNEAGNLILERLDWKILKRIYYSWKRNDKNKLRINEESKRK
jgi:hypothetical protein